MANNVKEVNGKELEELVNSGKTVVCDFWASWCGPCRMLAPVLDGLAAEFSDRASFVKVNVDDEGAAAAKYGVMSIPDVFVFEGGAVKAHNLGYLPESAMRAFLEKNI